MGEVLQSAGGNLAVVGVLVALFVGAAVYASRGEGSEPPPDGKRYPWIRLDDVLAVIRDPAWSWTRNWRCKYINIRMDTRSRANLCVIYDRHGQPITLEELKHQEQYGRRIR